MRARTTSGYDEASLNHRRLGSDMDDRNCSSVVSIGNRKKKNKSQKKKKSENKEKRRKRTITIGTWNVQTLMDTGKLHLLIRELEIQNINITGITECRWKGNGHFHHGDHYVIYSGTDKGGQSGVAVILDKEAKKGLISYNAVSDRILVVHIDTKPKKTTIIQVYAPTTSHPAEEIEEFYDQLQSVKDTIKNKNHLIVMGDLNAKVGKGGTRNESGEQLLTFCEANQLSILNTWFQNPPRRLYTWISPDGHTRNQIDYIMVSKDWQSSYTDCKTRPGADSNTDHNLLIAKLKMKGYRKNNQSNPPIRYALEKLHDSEIKETYEIQTQTRFEPLLEVQEENVPE